MLTISPEEAEELAFVPGALSEPRGAIYFCDNRCSDNAVRFWQFASVVVEEGGGADGAARQAEAAIRGNGEQSWRRRHIVEYFGES